MPEGVHPDSTQGRAFSVRTLGQGVPFAQHLAHQQNQPYQGVGGAGRRRKLAAPPEDDRAPARPGGGQQAPDLRPGTGRPAPNQGAGAQQPGAQQPGARQEQPGGATAPASPRGTGQNPDQPGQDKAQGPFPAQEPTAPARSGQSQGQPGQPGQPGQNAATGTSTAYGEGQLIAAPVAEGRAYAIGAPDEGAEGPEPLDGPGGAVEVALSLIHIPAPDHQPELAQRSRPSATAATVR